MRRRHGVSRTERDWSHELAGGDASLCARVAPSTVNGGIGCCALNDPKRLAILYALVAGPHSMNEMSELPQPRMSQHLAVLRDRALVDAERHGSRVIYTLRDPRVVDAIDVLREVMNDELRRRQALRSAR